MAKKQVREKRNGNPQKSPKTKGISKTTTTINTKNEDTNNINETTDDDASSEETEDVVAPSSSLESENDVVESDEDVVEKRSSSDEDEEEERVTLKSMKEKTKNVGVKNKGKRRSKKEDSDSEEENNEKNLYRFPMNRVSRIIKSEIPDLKISQEAVFVINRATEKFLQVFCREAYACAFLDNKKHTAYNHLSSVVSRRKRLKFLSDFIPEKVKAEDALALIPKADE